MKNCHTCTKTVDKYAAYCDDCIAGQLAENGGMTELEAFDAYHRWVDRF